MSFGFAVRIEAVRGRGTGQAIRGVGGRLFEYRPDAICGHRGGAGEGERHPSAIRCDRSSKRRLGVLAGWLGWMWRWGGHYGIRIPQRGNSGPGCAGKIVAGTSCLQAVAINCGLRTSHAVTKFRSAGGDRMAKMRCSSN